MVSGFSLLKQQNPEYKPIEFKYFEGKVMLEHYIDKNGNLKRIKDRWATAIIAFGLGWFGMHKFYLGKWVWGLIYLIFSWSVLPLIISIIEGVLYLLMSDEEFDYKYNN